MTEYHLDDTWPSGLETHNVETANGEDVRNMLVDAGPDVVLINGTRILKPHILEAVDAPFINTHVGITPAYRGVHGGYWALWNRDSKNFGTTVHLVDSGVDTGRVLLQVRPDPNRNDTFCSYPVLQQAAALHGIGQILQSLSKGDRLKPLPASAEIGRQWYHPTIGEYVAGWLRGVK